MNRDILNRVYISTFFSLLLCCPVSVCAGSSLLGANALKTTAVQNDSFSEAFMMRLQEVLLSAYGVSGNSQGNLLSWSEIACNAAIRSALDKNLSILQARGSKKIAEAAAREANAVFDPVVRIAVAQVSTEVHDRNESTVMWRKNTVSYGNDQNPFYVVLPDSSPVAYVKFDKERNAGYYSEDVVASKKSAGSADQWRTYYTYLSQKLPWGLDLNLSLGSLEKEDFWVNREDSWGSYKRYWRSTMSEYLAIPFPWAKNFGPHSYDEYKEKEAELGELVAYWHAKAIINDVLQETELAYWELVGGALKIKAVLEHQDVIGFLLKRTTALYNDRMATEYDIAQVKSELARGALQVKSSVGNYLIKSHRLSELLNQSHQGVYLPTGFASFLSSVESVPGDIDEINKNPTLIKQAVLVETAKLTQEYRRVMARPDLTINQSLIFSQMNSIFGFQTVTDSLSNVLASPDLIRHNYGLSYKYPLFNRSAQSTHSQAQLHTQKQKALLQFLENRAYREVQDAVISLQSIKARLKIADKVLSLAQTSYSKGADLQESREVTEYELVSKSTDLLNAKLQYDTLRIDNKKAQISLFGSLGILAQQYSKMVR